MMRILVSALLMVREQQRFRPELRKNGLDPDFIESDQFLKEVDLLPLLSSYDGMIAGDDQITERVLREAQPRLKVISKWGVGLDSIDCKAAERLGIRVYNSPGAFGSAVAETTLGYLLMLTRHLHHIDRAVRRGEWPKPVGTGLQGKVLGIVGFGSIGRSIAERAIPFGMEVIASDPRWQELESPRGVRFVPFDDLLPSSDHLCLACNLTDETRGLVGAAELARMKPEAFVINVARGPLIVQEALVEALAEQRIAGAALDVFVEEPLPIAHPLTSMNQVILGSHNANNLVSANEYVHQNTIANLLSGLRD